MLRTSRGRVEASFCRCRAAGVGIRAQGLLGAGGTAEHGAIGGGGEGVADRARAWQHRYPISGVR
jgi:hypothetical protein